MVKLFTKANSKNNNKILSDFSAVKAGRYLMKLVKDEWRDNKSSSGKHAAMQFKIVNTKYKDRIIYHNANLKHKNKDVVSIANKFINTLSQACGKKNVSDTKELMNIIVLGVITVKKATKTQPDSNDIQTFIKVSKKEIAKLKKADEKSLEEPDDDDDDIFEDEEEDDDDIFEDDDEEEEEDDDLDDDDEEDDDDDEEEEEEEEKEVKTKKKKTVKSKKKVVKSKKKKAKDNYPDF